MNIDKVINLNVDEEILKERITGRRLCKNCGEIYHIVNKPTSTPGICDKCGSPLSQRKDDTLESLTVRLNEYHKNTQPLLEYYEKQNLVHEINANQAPEKVFEEVKNAIEA